MSHSNEGECPSTFQSGVSSPAQLATSTDCQQTQNATEQKINQVNQNKHGEGGIQGMPHVSSQLQHVVNYQQMSEPLPITSVSDDDQLCAQPQGPQNISNQGNLLLSAFLNLDQRSVEHRNCALSQQTASNVGVQSHPPKDQHAVQQNSPSKQTLNQEAQKIVASQRIIQSASTSAADINQPSTGSKPMSKTLHKRERKRQKRFVNEIQNEKQAQPSLVKSTILIKDLRFGQLKSAYQTLFQKPTSSNNKEWILKKVTERLGSKIDFLHFESSQQIVRFVIPHHILKQASKELKIERLLMTPAVMQHQNQGASSVELQQTTQSTSFKDMHQIKQMKRNSSVPTILRPSQSKLATQQQVTKQRAMGKLPLRHATSENLRSQPHILQNIPLINVGGNSLEMVNSLEPNVCRSTHEDQALTSQNEITPSVTQSEQFKQQNLQLQSQIHKYTRQLSRSAQQISMVQSMPSKLQTCSFDTMAPVTSPMPIQMQMQSNNSNFNQNRQQQQIYGLNYTSSQSQGNSAVSLDLQQQSTLQTLKMQSSPQKIQQKDKHQLRDQNAVGPSIVFVSDSQATSGLANAMATHIQPPLSQYQQQVTNEKLYRSDSSQWQSLMQASGTKLREDSGSQQGLNQVGTVSNFLNDLLTEHNSVVRMFLLAKLQGKLQEQSLQLQPSGSQRPQQSQAQSSSLIIGNPIQGPNLQNKPHNFIYQQQGASQQVRSGIQDNLSLLLEQSQSNVGPQPTHLQPASTSQQQKQARQLPDGTSNQQSDQHIYRNNVGQQLQQLLQQLLQWATDAGPANPSLGETSTASYEHPESFQPSLKSSNPETTQTMRHEGNVAISEANPSSQNLSPLRELMQQLQEQQNVEQRRQQDHSQSLQAAVRDLVEILKENSRLDIYQIINLILKSQDQSKSFQN